MYYAVLLAPFAATSLLYPRSANLTKRVQVVLVPLVLGSMVGLLPVMYYAARNYELFMFNNLGYHQLNTQWRFLTEYDQAMTFFLKLKYAREEFFRFDNIAPVLGIAIFSLMALF